MANENKYYITTPIYYVNDAPHIGHAYTSLACDVLARFKRCDRRKVRFLTGTDEHGQKVEKSAQAAGKDTQSFCDEVSENFRDLAAAMNFSNDSFIRTTEERHKIACQDIWRRLDDADQIYLDSYAGWYSVRDEAFYAESELIENQDGAKQAPSGSPVDWVEEPSYFFKLSEWQGALLDFYRQNPDFIAPESRRNEVIRFVEGGLKDLSISRTSFDWGVPVPGDEDHVMYVWLDALTNYISDLGYPDTDAAIYRTFWPADVHMVGKDILRFHAVYWPAFLMAADLPLPKRVFAHGWWTNEGQKISKSLGNVIDPYFLIEEYGLDQVRYFLMREVPFGNDGDFSRDGIIARINGDLANDFGNLAQRCLSMVAKNCGGKIPERATRPPEDVDLVAAADSLYGAVRRHMDEQAFHKALEEIWQVIRAANGFFANQEPWSLKNSDPERMGTVLYVTMEILRECALVTWPFMPDAMDKLLQQLSVPKEFRNYDYWGDEGRLEAGTALPQPKAIFPRFVEAGEEGA